MSDDDARVELANESVDAFVDKWRARWPEWAVAQVFVPASQRGVVLAWASLQQELTDAAWGGSDPRPGEAKLAWWQEELRGWSQGARRHPLGSVLQRRPAPWAALAGALVDLRAARERPASESEAMTQLQRPADAIAAIDAALFAGAVSAPHADINAPAVRDDGATLSPTLGGLLLQRLLADAGSAAPLQTLARAGDAGAASAWRATLLSRWPIDAPAPLPRRILAGLAHGRLRRGDPAAPLPAWSALWTAWRAARN